MIHQELNTSSELKVEVRRIIRASRRRIYEAWTRPEELLRWFGPGAIQTTEATVDPRTGGPYRIVMQGSMDGEPEQRDRIMPVHGVYQELVPDQLIRFTWKPSWTPGEESEVTIRLQDVDGGTEIVLTHERFATTGSCNGHARGWTSSLDKLARYLGDADSPKQS